jgi:hypothetical protein
MFTLAELESILPIVRAASDAPGTDTGALPRRH